eukprot:3077395-Pleurochrysis_carterae.AAC.1
MVVGKKHLEAVLNLLSSSCVAQLVDLKVLGRQVVEAQHVAEANGSRSWHLAQDVDDALAVVGVLPQ